MHSRVQRFQTNVIEQICSLQSICQHSECCQRVCFLSFSRFALLLSSETQFSMIKQDSRLVRISFSFDACRMKRATGADKHASPICSKSLLPDARRSKFVSELFKSIFVISSNLLSSFPPTKVCHEVRPSVRSQLRRSSRRPGHL